MSQTVLLDVKNLKAHLPGLFHDLSFSLNEGEVLGVIGESGAGKSTLLSYMNLLSRPLSGQIYFEGEDLMTLSEVQMRRIRQRMGVVFQSHQLFTQKTMGENILLPLRLAGKDPKDQDTQDFLQYLLQETKLGDKWDQYPHQLSGGEKQRASLVRALIHHPKLLLCDEPTSALDPDNTQRVMDAIKTIQVKTKLAVVFVSHDVDRLKGWCHQLLTVSKAFHF